MPLLRVEDVTLRYPAQAAAAIDNVSFNVSRGEIVCLLGPSGSGKTSVLRVVAGFARPSNGCVWLDDREIECDHVFIPPEKRNIGFVFQDFALFPHMTVAENVRYGLRDVPSREATERVAAILERAQISEYATRKPHQLSGGQQQRVAIARAMAPRPRIILMDEPFGSLDPGLREDARQKIVSVLRENQMTAILVTHDQEEALSIADRVGVMCNGRLEQMGTPEELYNVPRTRFVASFVGGANVLRGEGRGDCAMTVIGRIPLSQSATGPVSVAVRPEHLELLSPHPDAPVGQVVSRHFHGHDVSIVIRIGDETVTAWDDYRCTISVGQSVSIRPRACGVIVD